MGHRRHARSPGPAVHLAPPGSIFDPSKAEFAHDAYPCGAHLVKVGFGQAFLGHRRPGNHLDTSWADGSKGALACDGERLDPHRVPGPTGVMRLTGRNDRGHPAVHPGLDPSRLVLPRCPVTRHGMGVVIDETGAKRSAPDVDHGVSGPGLWQARIFADPRDLAVFDEQGPSRRGEGAAISPLKHLPHVPHENAADLTLWGFRLCHDYSNSPVWMTVCGSSSSAQSFFSRRKKSALSAVSSGASKRSPTPFDRRSRARVKSCPTSVRVRMVRR